MTLPDKSFWKDRRVFVTGASGFLGANLTGELLSKGAQIVCLQRDEVAGGALDLLGLSKQVTLVHGNLEDSALLERILNEYEIESVFHLAAQALVGAANRSPVSTFESNIRGTYLLLEACRLSQTVKRIVVASSDKAYGSHSKLPYVEEHELRGLFPYDASKACTDILARSFAHTFKLPVVITRSANIYGPADLNLSRIVPSAIVSVLNNEPPIIRSDGTPVRELIFVGDVVSGYLGLAEDISKVQGEAFNLGTDERIQVLDLVNMIIRLMGKENSLSPNILLKTKIEREIDEQYLASEKIKSRIGWRAKVKLEEGLRRTVEWYAKHQQEIAR